jgi:hypothetical protein
MRYRQSFVVPKSEPLGIGKLVGRSSDTAEVEFFDSPFGPKVHRRQFRISQLRQVQLGADSDDVDQSFRSDADQCGAKRRTTFSV